MNALHLLLRMASLIIVKEKIWYIVHYSFLLSFLDSPIDDSESPWVPNVVLVENDLGNSDLENCSDNPAVLNDILHENGTLPDFENENTEELQFEGIYKFMRFVISNDINLFMFFNFPTPYLLFLLCFRENF